MASSYIRGSSLTAVDARALCIRSETLTCAFAFVELLENLSVDIIAGAIDFCVAATVRRTKFICLRMFLLVVISSLDGACVTV